jgi:hypothetical protein
MDENSRLGPAMSNPWGFEVTKLQRTLPKAKFLFYFLFLKKTNNFADSARKGQQI